MKNYVDNISNPDPLDVLSEIITKISDNIK